MRLFTAVSVRFAFIALLLLGITPAHAYWTTDLSSGMHQTHSYKHAAKSRYKPVAVHRHYQRAAYRGLSHSCAEAAREGGPCGCVVAEMLGLPRMFHGLNLWLARAWYGFPRTYPHAGAVAIWGTHHVELVSAVHDGRFDSVGSVGHSNVPVTRVTFVEPQRQRLAWHAMY